MFENTLELAESKLLLLYILNKVKFPVSNNQLTQIILENNLINYFTLQQYIVDMVSSNLLKYTDEETKSRIILTEKGIRVLSFFENRISEEKMNIITAYLSTNMEYIKREVTVSADYTIEQKDTFVVDLRAVENETTLIDIKLTVGSNKQARDLCTKWKTNSSDLYNKIINLLINE